MGEEISELNIELGLLITNLLAQNSSGRSSFVVLSDELQQVLADQYGRKNLCLKICREESIGPKGKPKHRFVKRLRDIVIIQNLFAYKGLAPRVYDLVLLNGTQLALVEDFIQRDTKHKLNSQAALQSEVFPKIKQLMEALGLYSGRRRLEFDTGIRNFVNGKLVDFNGFFFRNKKAFRLSLIRSICKGREGCMQYQSVPSLNIHGWRGTKHRIEKLRLDDIDFSGKAVLDLGCNLGTFSREACDRGAKRIVGIDSGGLGKTARELNNWLGYWQIDFFDLHLSRELNPVKLKTGLMNFDIVFSLSFTNHAEGYAKWIADLTSEVLLLEGHRGETKDTYWNKLNKDFKKVEYLGETSDQGIRPIFRCWA